MDGSGSSGKKKKNGTLDWFVNGKKKTKMGSCSSPNENTQFPYEEKDSHFDVEEKDSHFDVGSIQHDPGMRKKFFDYHPNVQDMVRREYMRRGPFQPLAHEFPQTDFGGLLRRFNSKWLEKYNWLEYSVEKDGAFCFFCYLFNYKDQNNRMGGDAFVSNRFKGWNRPGAFDKHIGKVNTLHNQAREKFEALTRPKTSIRNVFDHQSSEATNKYRERLLYSLYCLKYLLHQGLAFRGHREKKESSNKGNFLELLEWLGRHNEKVKEILVAAPKNHKMIAPSIQKDLINSCATETTKLIIDDVGDDYFAILVDESSDVSHKEQMALCLRYVDRKGDLIERFLSVVNVKDTTALTLRDSIYSVLATHSLSISKIRGQGYDGASNMKGEINGIKTLIMKETPSAYYVHCFAHQLQLTLVAVSKKKYRLQLAF